MDYQKIIDEYYGEGASALKTVLLTHSQSVVRKALQIVSLHPELQLDRTFIIEASMLHDIGIIRCDAPSIHCFGTQPYIRHGVEGAAMLRAKGLPRHARVCERHTGAGISLQEIERQQLPLPLQNFLPETLEEKVICYADKFFSKSHLERERNVEQAEKSLKGFGEDGLARFREWESMFE
jgi:uncharacterized protein